MQKENSKNGTVTKNKKQEAEEENLFDLKMSGKSPRTLKSWENEIKMLSLFL